MKNEYEVGCPMPDCDEALFVMWALSYALGPDNLADGASLIVPNDHHAGTWQVECANGHVILLPGDTGCPCPDPGGEGCPHDNTDEYDWSEDNRTLRLHDLERLRTFIARQADQPGDPGGAA